MRYSYKYKLECVEMYRQGKWPKCPNGITEEHFHDTIRKWVRVEESNGTEGLKHRSQNKVWSAEEKYELVAKVMAGASYRSTAFQAGIDSGLLRRWANAYIIKGYEGLTAQRKGRPPKEPEMKKKEQPSELTPSEREEMIRLKAEIEYLKAENEVIKKEIALREERCAAQLKARKQRSLRNYVKKGMP